MIMKHCSLEPQWIFCGTLFQTNCNTIFDEMPITVDFINYFWYNLGVIHYDY